MQFAGMLHLFGLLPPQTWGAMQGGFPALQSMMLLQPSVAMPQLKPCDAHVFGMHTGAPHLFAIPPPPHEVPVGHVAPQSIVLLQPSLTSPQLRPGVVHACANVFGMHIDWPHLFVPPPPQVSPGVVHMPQSSVPLQPSLVMPQSKPWPAHVFGVQGGWPQTFGMLQPPQVSPAFVQVPQSSVPPQPSPTMPQL